MWETWDPTWGHANDQAVSIEYFLMTSTVQEPLEQYNKIHN